MFRHDSISKPRVHRFEQRPISFLKGSKVLSKEKNAEVARYFALPCKPLVAELLLIMRNRKMGGVSENRLT